MAKSSSADQSAVNRVPGAGEGKVARDKLKDEKQGAVRRRSEQQTNLNLSNDISKDTSFKAHLLLTFCTL